MQIGKVVVDTKTKKFGKVSDYVGGGCYIIRFPKIGEVEIHESELSQDVDTVIEKAKRRVKTMEEKLAAARLL